MRVKVHVREIDIACQHSQLGSALEVSTIQVPDVVRDRRCESASNVLLEVYRGGSLRPANGTPHNITMRGGCANVPTRVVDPTHTAAAMEIYVAKLAELSNSPATIHFKVSRLNICGEVFGLACWQRVAHAGFYKQRLL